MDIFDRQVARRQQRTIQRKSDNLLKLYPELAGFLDRYEDPSRRALLIQQRMGAGVPLPPALLKAQKRRKRKSRRTRALRGDLAANERQQQRFTRGERRERDTEEPRIVGEQRQQPVNIYFGGAPAAAAAPGAPPPGVPPVPVAIGGGGAPVGPPPVVFAPPPPAAAPALDVDGLRAGIVADIAGRLPAPIDVDALRGDVVRDVAAALPAPADLDPILEEVAALRERVGAGDRARGGAIRAIQGGLDELARRRAQDTQDLRELIAAQQEGAGLLAVEQAEGQGDILGAVGALREQLAAEREGRAQQIAGIEGRLDEDAEARVQQQAALRAEIAANQDEFRHADRRRIADQEAVMERLGFNDANFDQLQAEAHQAFLQMHRFRQAEEAIAAEGGIMTREDRDELFRRQQQLLDYLHLGLRELGTQQTQARAQELQGVRDALMGGEGAFDPRDRPPLGGGAASPGASPRGLPHGLRAPPSDRLRIVGGQQAGSPRTPRGQPGPPTPESTGIEPPVEEAPAPAPEPEPAGDTDDDDEGDQPVGGEIPGQFVPGGQLQSSYVGFGEGGGVIDLGQVEVSGAVIGDLGGLIGDGGAGAQEPGVGNPAQDIVDRDPNQRDPRQPEPEAETTDEEGELDFENLPPVSDAERARLEEEAERQAQEAVDEGGGFGEEPDPPAQDPEATLEPQEPGGKKKRRKKKSKKKVSETDRRRAQDAELMDRMLEDNDQPLDDDDRRLVDEVIDIDRLDESEQRRRESARLFDDAIPDLAQLIRPGPRGGKGTGYRIRNNTLETILGIRGDGLVDIEGVETGRKGRGVYRLTPGQRHDVDSFYPHIRAGTLIFEKGSYKDVDKAEYLPTGEHQQARHDAPVRYGDPPGQGERPAVARFAADEFQEGFEPARPVRVESERARGPGGEDLSESETKRRLSEQITRKSTVAAGYRAQIRSLRGEAGGRRGDTGGANAARIAELDSLANILEREVRELRELRGPL